ncbi:MAG: carboxyltransferase domain-containing protein, partial [Paracoccus sp. (in: a-proteobacteria)]
LTPQVPAGALVVALRQVVMFGNASATGWQQVGRCAFRSFRPERTPPMPLEPGDAIRFAPIPAGDLPALEAEPDGLGGACCEVLT